jgi:miniconductance mechanosensitive channel
VRHKVYDFLIAKGISEETAAYLNMLILLLLLLLAAFIIDFITKRILWRVSESVAKRTKTNFDDILISNKLPRNIAHIIPLIILIEYVPDVFTDFLEVELFIEKNIKNHRRFSYAANCKKLF